VNIDPRRLGGGGQAVVELAQAAYQGSAFEGLPVLADALEGAGCDREDLLAHCRSGGRHFRGCWALDALLGKTDRESDGTTRAWG
jgi:hypothetical protein